VDVPADGCGAHIMQDNDGGGGAAVTLDVCPRTHIIFFIHRYNIHRGRGVITRGIIIIILCVHTPWAYTHTPDFFIFYLSEWLLAAKCPIKRTEGANIIFTGDEYLYTFYT